MFNVKGQKVNSLRQQKISYPIYVADLKNFRSVGGTILFVVNMLDFDSYKVYYNSLLPLDLEEILQTIKPEQKNKEYYIARISKN